MTKRALLLISDTGGGHRSAANAIAAALDEIPSPNSFEHRIEDVAAHCAFPLTQLGLGYSMALRYAPPVYGALYYATNGRRRYRALVRFCEPLYRERLRDLFIGYQPDIIVSVHPLLNHAALRARDDARMHHVPIVTVITDLGKVHESWLVADADAVVVPAREVYQRALSRGVPSHHLHLLGHPISPKFDDVTGSKADLRAALGLPQDAFVVMLMAGGEGGGKLLSTSLALARARLPIELVVVCGRNEPLEQKLRELSGTLPTPMHVLGFTNKIPEYFRAVDLLVTSIAGPARLFGIAGKGRIAAGYDADFTIVDLKRRETIRDSWIASRAGWTPYDGKPVTGWPVGTIVRGIRVMWQGELTTPAQGAAVRFAEAL